MANSKRRASGKKTNRPRYSAAERKAFRAGMAKQYDNEHPKFGFAAALKHTVYNEDGSVFGSPSHGKVNFFKTEKEAKDYVTSVNKRNKFANERVLKNVRAKKVNVYDSKDCSTSVAEYKRLKPMRDKGELYDYCKL